LLQSAICNLHGGFKPEAQRDRNRQPFIPHPATH
jgi:hypothetical protein